MTAPVPTTHRTIEQDRALDLLAESDLLAVERQLGLQSPDEQIRDAIALALCKTIQSRSVAVAEPKAVKALLKNVGVSASALRAHVQSFFHDITPAVGDAGFLLGLSDHTIDFMDLADVLDRLEVAAAAADQLVPQLDGRRPDIERHMLLRRLEQVMLQFNGGIDRKYTKIPEGYRGDGKAAYSGDLFLMFKAAENALAGFYHKQPLTDGALAKFIERSFAPDKTHVPG